MQAHAGHVTRVITAYTPPPSRDPLLRHGRQNQSLVVNPAPYPDSEVRGNSPGERTGGPIVRGHHTQMCNEHETRVQMRAQTSPCQMRIATNQTSPPIADAKKSERMVCVKSIL